MKSWWQMNLDKPGTAHIGEHEMVSLLLYDDIYQDAYQE
jgi:hypothetical protein